MSYKEVYILTGCLFLIAMSCNYVINQHIKKNFLSRGAFRSMSFIAFFAYLSASALLFGTLQQ